MTGGEEGTPGNKLLLSIVPAAWSDAAFSDRSIACWEILYYAALARRFEIKVS